MRGWVYIISNKSMEGRLKVGFTLKDPIGRAKELNSTGLPDPYEVEYEVLLKSPRDLEQKVHKRLHAFHVGKEWFNCSITEAIGCIRDCIDGDVFLENIRNPENAPEYITPQEQPEYEAHQTTTQKQEASRQKPKSSSAGSKKQYKPYTSPFKMTEIFSGPCSNCGDSFKVTISRYDTGAICPICRTLNQCNIP